MKPGGPVRQPFLSYWADRIVGPARQAGGIDSLKSIPGLLKVLQIRTLYTLPCKIFYFKIYFIIAHPFYRFL
jgi:hypothetical protein